MTKIAAALLAGSVEMFLALLPGRRRAAVRARLYARLKPFMAVTVGGHALRLLVPDRSSLYWATRGPQAEPDTNAWIASFGRDDVLFDVGANVGFYSLLAAAQGVRRVYAFEPNPLSHAALVENIFANRFEETVVPLNVAVAERMDMATFGLSSLEVGTVGNEIGGGAYQLTVPAFSLDGFIRVMGIGAVTRLKIDVDGLEAAILKGSAELLGHPGLKSVLVEINDANASESGWMLAYLGGFGFREVPPPVSTGSKNKFFRRDGAARP
jgi:methyltransferase, FkbM family